MARERERKSWREVDRARITSYRSETLDQHGQTGKQTAAVKEYKAALEALFQKKPDAADKIEQMMPSVKMPKVVEAAQPDAPVSVGTKRQDLLRKLSAAQGTKAISDVTDAFHKAGFILPDDQEVYLQILEHRDESRVREAIAKLEHLLAGQLPKRKPVLVQRLKRLEEVADEEATRDAALALRRKVG
jgi:hypothetical protein